MPTDDLMALEDESRRGPGDDPDEQPRGSPALSALAILLSLGAIVLSGWAWWEFRDPPGEPGAAMVSRVDSLQQAQERQAQALSSLRSQLEALPLGSEEEHTAELRSALGELRDRTQALEQELEARRSYGRSLQQAVEAMQARLMAAESALAAGAPVQQESSAQLDLAGVGYLLRLAPERLALYHDVQSADEALAQADAQLTSMDSPLYIGLRQHIAEARRSLADADLPNPVELSARLDTAQERLAGLEFAGETAAPRGVGPGSDAAAEQGWWERLKGSVGGLVTVRRTTDDPESRLTLEDKDLLRQGLWMQIEAARLALMRHDQAAWNDALDRATGVLERWFDASSPAYEAVHQELDSLSEVAIDPALPDITGPWAQLQLIRQARGAIPAPPAGEAVIPVPDEPAVEDKPESVQPEQSAQPSPDADSAETDENA